MPKQSLYNSREGRRITWIGMGANTTLIIIKFLAGYFGHSQAMIADAVHSLSDFFTDAVVLFGLKAGRRAPDESHPYGHAKIETTASAVVGLILIATAALIGYQAGLHIYLHQETHPTWLAMAAAVLSLGIKEALYQYTVRAGRRIKSAVVTANAWHHRSDAMSSVAVLLGLIGTQISPNWHILDAYATLLVAFFIAKVGLDVLWSAFKEMTDTAPDPKVLRQINACIQDVSGVLGQHDLKVRSAGGIYQIQVHVLVDGGITVEEGHHIAKNVEQCLYDQIVDTGDVIVHLDPQSTSTHPKGQNHEET